VERIFAALPIGRDRHNSMRLLMGWLLDTGRITRAPPNTLGDPQYVWTPDGYPATDTQLATAAVAGQPMNQLRAARGGRTVLEWLIDNTPPDQWWSLDKWVFSGQTRTDGSEVKDYNPLRLKMSEAGISYNHAWTILDRAFQQGLVMKGDRGFYQGKYRWTAPDANTPSVDPEVGPLAAQLAKLSDQKKRAVLVHAGITASGNYLAKDDYTLSIEDFDVSLATARLSLRYKDGFTRTVHVSIEAPPEEFDILQEMVQPDVERLNYERQQKKLRTYDDIVPRGNLDLSPEELRAIEENRRELAMLESTDFEYETPQ